MVAAAFAIKPRDSWTDTDAGGASQDADDQLGIACHWPGTTADRYGQLREAQVVSLLNGWRNYHVNVRGWSDIGYNYAIDTSGRIWELRGMNRIGAHSASDENPGANDNWVGVLFIVGEKESVPAVMVQAFRWLRTQILKRFPKGTRVVGHRQVKGAETACPGPEVMEVMTQLDDAYTPEKPEVPVPETPGEDGEEDMFIYLLGRSVYFRIHGDRAVNIPKYDVDIHVKRGFKVIPVSSAYGNSLRAALTFEGVSEARFKAAVKEADEEAAKEDGGKEEDKEG